MNYSARFVRFNAILNTVMTYIGARRLVLEYGCGDGTALPYLANAGFQQIVGIDYDYARHESRAIPVVAADLRYLPFALSLRADLIVVRHPDIDRQRAGWAAIFGACRDRLAEQGIVIITTYTAGECTSATAACSGLSRLAWFNPYDPTWPPPDLSSADSHVAVLVADPAAAPAPDPGK